MPATSRSARWSWPGFLSRLTRCLPTRTSWLGGISSRHQSDRSQVQIALPAAIRSHQDVFAVRMPRREIVLVGVIRYSPDTRAVGVHDIDLVVAVPVAGEGNLLAVGRPGRADVHAAAFC